MLCFEVVELRFLLSSHKVFQFISRPLLSGKAPFVKIVISTYKLCKIVYRALWEKPPVQFSLVQPAGSSCYALRLLNSDFCESSRGNNLLHVGRKEPHVSKISWHHALGSTLFSNSKILRDLAQNIL